MRRHYPIAVLLILLAAIALSASLVTTNANALPTFNTAVGGIGPCDSCHTMSTVHAVTNHIPLVCANCHPTGTETPLPSKCTACHGPAGTAADHLAFILARATHVTTGCGTTAGCHGVPSATATITSFAPASGPVGTVVTVTGTGFTGATAVAFNSTAALTFTVDSATQITATVPVGATTGKITVTPASGPVATSATNFTVGTAAVTTKITLKVAPKSIKLRKTVKATGTVKPVDLGGKASLTAQRKSGSKWVKTKTAKATVKATGKYSWTYKPAKKGTYRIKASIKATATKKASHSPWRTFKVK